MTEQEIKLQHILERIEKYKKKYSYFIDRSLKARKNLELYQTVGDDSRYLNRQLAEYEIKCIEYDEKIYNLFKQYVDLDMQSIKTIY